MSVADPRVATTPVTMGRRFWTAVSWAAALSVVVRIRFLFTPLTVDEAGALLVARAWADGGMPYTDVWVDRPHGVLLLYRIADALPGDGTFGVRLLGAVAGVIVVVAGALAAARLSRPRGGVIAAFVIAAAISSPAIEGHTANGELLAAALSVPAMAGMCAVLARRRGLVVALAAGVSTAAALAVKQSGFDVLIGLGFGAVAAMLMRRRWLHGRDLAALALFALGAIGGTIAWLTHGAAEFGWEAYRFAVWDARVQTRTAVEGAEWGSLLGSTAAALPSLLGAGVGLVWLRRVRRPLVDDRGPADDLDGRADDTSRISWRWPLVAGWVVAASLAFAAGGNFHRHYWVGMVAPLGVAMAMAAAPLCDRLADEVRHRWLALVVALPIVCTMVFVAVPSLERDPRLDSLPGLDSWFATVASPDDRLYALCGNASLYVQLDQQPDYRYLWVDHVSEIDGAAAELAAYIESDDGAYYVAVFQEPATCDSSGAVAAALLRLYAPVAEVDGVTVLQRRSAGG